MEAQRWSQVSCSAGQYHGADACPSGTQQHAASQNIRVLSLHTVPFCDFLKTLEYTFPTIFLAKIVTKSRFWRLTGAVVLSLLSEVCAECVRLGSRGKEVIIFLESSANMTKSASSCKHGTHNSTLSCCLEQRCILGACSQRAAECYLKLHCLVTIKMLQDCVKGV